MLNSKIQILLAVLGFAITFGWADQPAACDVTRAQNILSGILTGTAFCSSLIYPRGISTVTSTVTVTAATTCITKTKTKVTHLLLTETEYSYINLPQPTSTAYGSTVFVTLGAASKRAPATTLSTRVAPGAPAASDVPASTFGANRASAARAKNATPAALSTCNKKIVSSACSLIVPASTVSVTVTPDPKALRKPCTTETVEVTSYNPKHIVTVTETDTATPGAATIVSSPSATLTLTVPARCLGPYYEGGEYDANEFTIRFPEYPSFPIDPVYCCLECFLTPNCVASYYSFDLAECDRLVRINTTPADGPANSQCPLGTGNFPFANPGTGVLQGPCG